MGGVCLVVGGLLAPLSGGGCKKNNNLTAFITFLKTPEPTACSSRTGVLPHLHFCTAAVLLLWVVR